MQWNPIVALLITSSVATACPPHYDVEIAYAPRPFMDAQGFAINDAGDIVGATWIPQRAFVWKAGAATIEMLPIPNGPCSANAINNSGQIVGEYSSNSIGTTHGYLLDGATFTDLGTLPGGNWSQAFDINDSGTAVGFWGNVVSGPGLLAMEWTSGVMTDLSSAIGALECQANAINQSGIITGFFTETNYWVDSRAFVLDGDQLVILPPVEGGATSVGKAINNFGQVVGYGFAPCDPPQSDCMRRKAFFWDGSAFIDLGSPLGLPNPAALGVNDMGQVVGAADDAIYNWESAFLWQDGSIHLLEDLADLSGMFMYTATDINNAGQIVGSANVGHDVVVVRLTPTAALPADLDCDRIVGAADLALLLGSWGMSDVPADIDHSGAVDALDLGILLSAWGT